MRNSLRSRINEGMFLRESQSRDRQPATLSNISTVGAQEMQKKAGVLSCQSSSSRPN
jgi:hypothetical protein